MPGSRHCRLFAVTLLLLLSALPCRAFAADAQPLVMETEDEVRVRWDLTADVVNTLNDEEILEATGNVKLRRGNEYMEADFARYYMSTKWVYLKGNVILRSGGDELTAEEAEFDLRSRVGWLKKGRIFMAGPHTYIAGDRIDKHWGDIYTFKQAKFTACDGEVPAWSFTADEAVVEIDGYARLSRAVFQVADVPALYAPWFIAPAKTRRQTGFLAPEFGRSSEKGAYYNQPFFWAIDESSDMTFNEYYMEKRGFMQGIEYRARPSADTTGWIRGDWLYDDKRKMNSEQGSYGGDGYVRNNHERWWLRGMLDTTLAESNLRFKADLDLVSDHYFLSEFKSDFSGFSRSRDELFEFFSRDLQERDLSRLSGFLLSKDWERGSISVASFYRQDPTLGNGNRSRSLDNTVQQLPQFDAFLHKGRIIESLPFEIEGSAQAAYMYRRTGTRGMRYEAIPRISLPVNTEYGSIIASGGLYQTFYETELPSRTRDDDRAPRQDDDDRTIPEFEVNAQTDFARVYNLDRDVLELVPENAGTRQWAALRHSIQPRVGFRHRVNEDQERNPRYVAEDRLEAQTEMVYSITNVLTVKEEFVTMGTDEKSGEAVPQKGTSYRELARLLVEHSYDFREAHRSDHRDDYERRAHGDIFTELLFYPWAGFYITTRNHWSPYENELIRHQLGVGLSHAEYGNIYVGYDRQRRLDEYKREPLSKVSYARIDLETAKFWDFSLRATLRHDLENLDNRENDIDIIYNHQCFQIIGRVSVDPQDENYQLYVVLTGLGD